MEKERNKFSLLTLVPIRKKMIWNENKLNQFCMHKLLGVLCMFIYVLDQT